MYTVTFGVKGAYKIKQRKFPTLTQAAQFAARWRRSNSIGSYVARVSFEGKELSV